MAIIQLTPFTTADRVLCVCQYGHSRSVALARFLHSQNIPAVAIGWQTAGQDFADAIVWQSTKIVTLQAGYLNKIVSNTHGLPSASNCICFDIGPDRWVNPYNAELANLLEKMFTSYQADPRQHITPADVGIDLQ